LMQAAVMSSTPASAPAYYMGLSFFFTLRFFSYYYRILTLTGIRLEVAVIN